MKSKSDWCQIDEGLLLITVVYGTCSRRAHGWTSGVIIRNGLLWCKLQGDIWSYKNYRVSFYNCPHRFLSLLNNRLYFKIFLAYIYSLEHVNELFWLFGSWVVSKGIFMAVEKTCYFCILPLTKFIEMKFISE